MEAVFAADLDTGNLVDEDVLQLQANLKPKNGSSDSLGSTGSNKNETSPLHEMPDDNFQKERKPKLSRIPEQSLKCADLRTQHGLIVIITSSIVFSAAITVALIIHIYVGEPQVPLHGAVAADAKQCSVLGTNIMKQGGSTVDAAISTILCEGVMNPMSSGIGGGGFMLIYDPRPKTKQAIALDFRETAPAKSEADMYKDNPNLAITGNLAVAVPGMLKGLQKAHKMFGSLSWKSLVKPVADLARKGYKVHEALSRSLECHTTKEEMSLNENLKKIFIKDGRLVELGDDIKFPTLADTLDIIAEKGAESFYDGELTQSIIDEMKNGNIAGIITKEDLKSYTAEQREVLNATIAEYNILTMPPPSSGAVILQVLNVIEGYNTSMANGLFYHRLVEAFKFAYAQRTFLGDPNFTVNISNVAANMISEMEAVNVRNQINDSTTYNESQHYGAKVKTQNAPGTMHVSLIGPDQVMVAATTSLNYWFGSKMMTKTGILLNNHIADFNVGGEEGLEYKANNIQPGKRPLSSMAPTILYHTKHACAYHMSLGASNGTRILTGIVQAILQNVTFHHNLEESIELKRIHHQLYPNILEYEKNFTSSIIDELRHKGHKVQESGDMGSRCNVTEGLNVVQAVGKSNLTLNAHSDTRKFSNASIF